MSGISSFFDQLMTVVAIFVGALLAYWIVIALSLRWVHVARHALGSSGADDRRVATLSALIRLIGGIIIFFVAGSMALNVLRIDIAPLLTGAGIAGLIATFSVQSLLKDIFAGVFILLEMQYTPGMRVMLNDVEGVVERLSLRTTVLTDEKGNRFTIPNGSITVVKVFAEEKG